MELFAFIAAYIFLAAAYDFLFPDWMQRYDRRADSAMG
jgi:hypothetical protein